MAARASITTHATRQRPGRRGYPRQGHGNIPRRPGIFTMGRGISPPAGDVLDGPGIFPRPGIFPMGRAGNIPAGRGYSQWGPGISPPAGDIPDGPGDIPAGRGYSRSGREYSRRPGIFPTGPRIRGSRERSRSPAGIFPAGRGYPRLARGHYHELAALKMVSLRVRPPANKTPGPQPLMSWRGRT